MDKTQAGCGWFPVLEWVSGVAAEVIGAHGWKKSLCSMHQSLSLVLLIAVQYACVRYSEAHHFTNEWAVEIHGGKTQADQVAQELGYRNKGQVSLLHFVI